ncbi:hypothetical protein HJ003_02985 [Vibrio parahaemolyticus]|nr:hypothetical protein [Vibrio parahaemolyticus]
MSGYQFLHVESYANTSTKKGKPSMQSVVNEAMREEGYCPHVEHPQRPQILFGVDPRTLPQVALNRSLLARDKLGRKIRKDAPMLLGGVISVESESSVDFKAFIKRSIEFLQKKYGKNLMSVILHLDETNPHLHYYSLPSVVDGVFSMSQIHDGIRGRNECKGGYSQKAHAYKEAMRKFQDEYYEEVGVKLGMTRLGPRVQRLTRKEWKAQQKQAQALIQQRKDANKRQRLLDKKEVRLSINERAIGLQEKELASINGTSFFSKKYEEKNRYLRKRLRKLQAQRDDSLSKIAEQSERIAYINQEVKSLTCQNISYQRKFSAMAYKLEMKDQFIQQLKLKTSNDYEKKYYRDQQYTCHP